MPKRGKGNRCRPKIDNAPENGAIDVLQIDVEGDNLHLNISYTSLVPFSPVRLQVYLSFNGGPYRMVYTIYPQNVSDAVAISQPYQVGDTYSYYYQERSQSGELQTYSNVVDVVI